MAYCTRRSLFLLLHLKFTNYSIVGANDGYSDLPREIFLERQTTDTRSRKLQK